MTECNSHDVTHPEVSAVGATFTLHTENGFEAVFKMSLNFAVTPDDMLVLVSALQPAIAQVFEAAFS